MKNIFLFACTLFIAGITFSQNSFQVLLDINDPIEGVNVYYKQKRIGLTSKEGKFLMPQAPAGDTIVFKYADMNTKYVIQKSRSANTSPQVIYLNPTKENAGTSDPYGFYNLPEAAPEPKPRSEDEILSVVDEHAEFPGGNAEFMKWLNKNIQYPPSALKEGFQGKCYVRFVVEKDGSITDIKVMRGIAGCPECDMEAVRVLKTMPKWKPGKVRGAAVRSYFNLPIVFKTF